MIPLGLSGAEQAAFHAALTDSHSIAVSVQVLDLDHNRIANLTDRLLDGQVNIDALAYVSRSCTLSLLDVQGSMPFDGDSPSDTAVYANRMIQVQYGVKVEALARWVWVPVFTGPVIRMDRTGDVVNVEAHGKEVLSQGAAWTPDTHRKGMRKVDAIWQILRAAGETKFSLTEWVNRLPADYSIARETVPWSAAQHIAHSMNLRLVYDGRGYCRLQPLLKNPVWRFEGGTGGSVLSPARVSYDTSDLKNIVWVIGGVPKGSQKVVATVKQAPPWHPLSPSKLGRGGRSRYLLEIIQNSAIVSQQEAERLAYDTLDQKLLEAVDVQFTSLPIPHLEPLDVCTVSTDDYTGVFRVKQLSIPLGTGEMTVGYMNNVSTTRRRIQRAYTPVPKPWHRPPNPWIGGGELPLLGGGGRDVLLPS